MTEQDSRHPPAKRAKLGSSGGQDLAASGAEQQQHPAPLLHRQAHPPLKPRRFVQFQGLQVHVRNPAAVFANRLAARCTQQAPDAPQDEVLILEAYIANGAAVYRVPVPLPQGQDVERGKEGVLLPQRMPGHEHTSDGAPPVVQHAWEVQSVSLSSGAQLGGNWLGSASSRGHALIHLLRNPQASDGDEQAPVLLQLPPTDPTQPVALEPGWAGVSVSDATVAVGDLGPRAATALHFPRRLRFFQGEQCMRTAHTLQPPTCITFLPGDAAAAGPVAGLLACAEGHQVSLWDVRQGERQGLVQRLPVSMAGYPLFSLGWCTAEGGLLGAAGAERTVTLLEPRKWRALHKWAGAAKYAIHHCIFSHAVAQACWVAGLDYECVCGRWDRVGGGTAGNANSATGHGHGRAVGPSMFVSNAGRDAQQLDGVAKEAVSLSTMSFRGDARWYGLCRALGAPPKHDMVVASTQTGSVFVLDACAPA